MRLTEEEETQIGTTIQQLLFNAGYMCLVQVFNIRGTISLDINLTELAVEKALKDYKEKHGESDNGNKRSYISCP